MPSTESRSRLPGLDTLRATAILAVMIFHLQSYLPDAFAPVAGVGWMGVDLFFVLSGYLIGTQLLRPYGQGTPLRLAAFYARRAFRILPAYFVILLLYFFVPVWREWPGLAAAWKFLTFTENILLRYPAEVAFSHAWSLCVEEHFYLLLPLLLLWLMREPKPARVYLLIAGIVLAGLGLRAWQVFHVLHLHGRSEDQVRILFMTGIYYPTWTRLDGLVAGVSLGALQLFRPRWWSRVSSRGTTLSLAAVAWTGGAMWLFNFHYPDPANTVSTLFGFPLLAVGLAILVAAATCSNGPLTRRVPGTRAVATLAFSLYLSHKGVAHVDRTLLPQLTRQGSWTAAALYALTCGGFAAVLFFAVERPFLLLRRWTYPGRKSSPGAEARMDPAL